MDSSVIPHRRNGVLLEDNKPGSRYRIWGSHEDNLPEHRNINKVKGMKNARLWSPKIPSRKRSRVMYKKITPMKRFQKQLLRMWKNYGNPDESEVLLFNNFELKDVT
ncbi:hypothetical protein CR513_21797, partial [Mucuna pruriens]